MQRSAGPLREWPRPVWHPQRLEGFSSSPVSDKPPSAVVIMSSATRPSLLAVPIPVPVLAHLMRSSWLGNGQQGKPLGCEKGTIDSRARRDASAPSECRERHGRGRVLHGSLPVADEERVERVLVWD